MISKKRCKEFVDVIRKMPGHQHVLKTIEEARELGREPGPKPEHTNGIVEKCTTYV